MKRMFAGWQVWREGKGFMLCDALRFEDRPAGTILKLISRGEVVATLDTWSSINPWTRFET